MRCLYFSSACIDELDHRICSTGPNAVLRTVEAGSTYSGILTQYGNVVIAELVFDALTIQKFRVMRSGTQRSRKNDRGNTLLLHI